MTYKLKADRFDHKAGTIAYSYHGQTFGLKSEDERATGKQHLCLTLKPSGETPFFTIPAEDVYQLAPHEERVVEERDELAGKLERLKTFASGGVYAKLSKDEKADLEQQAIYMGAYLGVLNRRIGRFGS